jgi:3-hydroxybutyryl-CoA dehydrogenase
MTIAIAGHTMQLQETLATALEGHQWLRVDSAEAFADITGADAYLDCRFDGRIFSDLQKPLLIGETVIPLEDMNFSHPRMARFCAWPGFASRLCWEIALPEGSSADWLTPVLEALGKSFVVVKDVPGLVAPRVLANIINEACYLLGDEVATAQDVDIAMRLGTNYPLGPVEWARIIGLENIHRLLTRLSEDDSRYLPHPLLAKL